MISKVKKRWITNFTFKSALYIISLEATQLISGIYVIVPLEKIKETACLFIGDIVQILISENKEGVKYLEDIKRAA